LARKLAKANETLPKERRYGTNGSTSEMTMLQQITRALKGTRGLGLEKLTPDELAYALNWLTNRCRWDKEGRLGSPAEQLHRRALRALRKAKPREKRG
jgi:hypothetical protein